MSPLGRIAFDRRFYPLWVLLLAALLWLPGLGSFGFWEPSEMEIAAEAVPKSDTELAAEREQEEKSREAMVKAEERDRQQRERKEGRPLTEAEVAEIHNEYADRRAKDEARKDADSFAKLQSKLIEASMSALGRSEGPARLPLVLLGLLTLLVTYGLGTRLQSARTGLFAALILIASPLIVFQSRQLGGSITGVFGNALLMWGALGLVVPTETQSWARNLVDALALSVGAVVSLYAAGFFVGLLPIILSLPVASIAALPALLRGTDSRRAKLGALLAAGALTLVAIGLFAYFFFSVFAWVDAGEGEWDLGGKTFHVKHGAHWLVAGSWSLDGHIEVNFHSLFKQVAFGFFPWVAILPIALLRLVARSEDDTGPNLGSRGYLFFTYALVSWLVASIALRKVGPVFYLGLPVFAVAVAAWLDSFLAEREAAQREASEEDVTGAALERRFPQLAPPLVALFAFSAIVVLSKDIKAFPAELASLHLDTAIRTWPEDLKVARYVMLLGLAFGLALAGAIYFFRPGKPGSLDDITQAVREGREDSSWGDLVGFLHWAWAWLGSLLSRYGVRAALALGVMLTAFLAQVWTPALSEKFSSKKTFAAYEEVRAKGDLLGIVGSVTPGTRFYGGDSVERLSGRTALESFLSRDQRVFALAQATELCALQGDAPRKGFDFYVIDDSHADKVMLSNRMWSSDAPPPTRLHGLMRRFLDKNPLANAIVRERPKNIKTPLHAVFDDKIELIGVDLPERVSQGDSFEVTLYYKILKRPARSWQTFAHFDKGVRIIGDHWAFDKTCATNYWQAGDYIIDTFRVDGASGMGQPTGEYKLWTGFFTGSSGNWTNMKVTDGEHDDADRVPAGSIIVE